MTTNETPTPTADGSSAPISGLMLQDAAGVLNLDALPDGELSFWKPAMAVGRIKDARGKDWPFTPDDVDAAVQDGKRALAMGWRPPIVNDHTEPTEGFGFITDVRKGPDGRYEQQHTFASKADRNAALKRHTSVCLLPNYTDPHGQFWKWFPDHSAAIFRPQSKFLPHYQRSLAASDEPADATCLMLADIDTSTGASPQKAPMIDLTQLRARLGDAAKDKPDEQIPALALAALDQFEVAAAVARDAFEPEYVEGKSAPEVLALAAEQIKPLYGKLTEAVAARDEAMLALSATPVAPAGGEPLMLSASTPSTESPAALSFYADGLDARRQAAISAGGCDVATADALSKLFTIGNRPSALALADSAGKPLLSRLWEILARNRPSPPLGEAKRLELADRDISQPGAVADPNKPDPKVVSELRQMAKLTA